MSATFDTTKWYRHEYDYEVRPLVADADHMGYLPVVFRDGHYNVAFANLLTPIPERHTVEWRVPKMGEQAIDYNGTLFTANHLWSTERWVIADDEVTS